MLRKQKLHIALSRIANLWGIGINDHSLLHDGVAGGNQLILARKLYHTDTACTDVIDTL